MVLAAAGIFLGAATLNLVEAAIPGGPTLSVLPGIGALCLAILIWAFAGKLPDAALFWLGPAGATLIAVAVGTTDGPGDGAILYIWAVLWQAYFFGRRGAITIVIWIALVHGLAILYLPSRDAYFDRWLDVVASATLVAFVVEFLATRNRKLVDQLVEEARIDKLTGVLNRRGFVERADAEMARAQRETTWVGIASFDLDNFKAINDEFGHEIGDRVLARVADLFRAEMRESDVLARMGGEEFVALLPGEGPEEATEVAERVRQRLRDADDSELPSVTVSAGVVSVVAPENLDDVLRAADNALYEAKVSGRDRTITRMLQEGSAAAI
jgi:diguanylate cyclase (GGDEF)-like protein